jgi:hypothetical protein
VVVEKRIMDLMAKWRGKHFPPLMQAEGSGYGDGSSGGAAGGEKENVGGEGEDGGENQNGESGGSGTTQKSDKHDRITQVNVIPHYGVVKSSTISSGIAPPEFFSVPAFPTGSDVSWKKIFTKNGNRESLEQEGQMLLKRVADLADDISSGGKQCFVERQKMSMKPPEEGEEGGRLKRILLLLLLLAQCCFRGIVCTQYY